MYPFKVNNYTPVFLPQDETNILRVSNESVKREPCSLEINVVERTEWPELSKIARAWLELSTLRSQAIPPSDPMGAVFEDSATLCKGIKHLLKGSSCEDEHWDTVLTCSYAGSIQCIALHSFKESKLAYIVTHPKNIRFGENNENDRVRGAPTKVIMHLAMTSLYMGQPLRLMAFKSSVGFYKKLNFEEMPLECGFFDADEVTPLKLTPERIRDLILRKIEPFNQLILLGESNQMTQE